MNYSNFHIAALLVLIFFGTSISAQSNKDLPPLKVGWIGSMTGPTAKWGSYQSAILGEEEVNKNGGINGRPLQLIYEDGQTNSTKAVAAFHKLSGADGVSFILGGHCSPETMAFTPLAERKKIVTIAAITSSPRLTKMGDYIFRLTPVSTRLADLLVPYAQNVLHLNSVSVIYELTDYVEPVAKHFQKLLKESGGTLISETSFVPGETDFKSILLRAARKNPEMFYIGTQAPDTALLFMKQIKELNLKQKVIGNEQFSGAFATVKGSDKSLLEGVIFAEPLCDLNRSATKQFADLYKQRYQVKALPFSCYTAEPYDAVLILAQALRKCGEDTECVKGNLYSLRNYEGASGKISFDANGDVDKEYEMKIIKQGKIEVIQSK